MNWRVGTIIAVGGLGLILLAVSYAGMLMRGD